MSEITIQLSDTATKGGQLKVDALQDPNVTVEILAQSLVEPQFEQFYEQFTKQDIEANILELWKAADNEQKAAAVAALTK